MLLVATARSGVHAWDLRTHQTPFTLPGSPQQVFEWCLTNVNSVGNGPLRKRPWQAFSGLHLLTVHTASSTPSFPLAACLQHVKKT